MATVASCCWLFRILWPLGSGGCRGDGYIDVVQYHSLETVYTDLGVGAVQGDLREPVRFCLMMMLPEGECGED